MPEQKIKTEVLGRISKLGWEFLIASYRSFPPVGPDLIVIPVIPSPDDVRSLNRLTLPVVKASGRPFVFVMSKARLHTRLLASTIAALSEHGMVSQTIIEQREGYAVSALSGSTLLEDDPNGKGAKEMRELWEFVKSRIDERTKARKIKEVIHV